MKYLIRSFLFLTLAACSAKVTSNSPSSEEPFKDKDTRELRVTKEPLSGAVDNQPWKIGKAIAMLRDREYDVTITGEGVDLTCNNFFPFAPQISFFVPGTPAHYPYDGSAGGRLVNFNFPYHTGNGGGSTNILASKSHIHIIELRGGFLIGNVAALSPEKETSHIYDIAGAFEAEVCPK
ncbi:MAG: hypothetical protein AB7H97_22760 [Pseudobdellovibrionaceae bacterium]